jgi:chromosome segregation ATPase
MSGESPEGRRDERLEELLRVNASLAAEVRNLTLGRADAPRSGAMPTARRLAAIIGERDSLASELEIAQNEVGALRGDLEKLEARNRELTGEVERLRSGFAGLLRRARARLLHDRAP